MQEFQLLIWAESGVKRTANGYIKLISEANKQIYFFFKEKNKNKMKALILYKK